MAPAMLTINSKNYGSWSLRGWLLCKLAGLDFVEQMLSSDDPTTRAELLLLSPSFLVPCLTHDVKLAPVCTAYCDAVMGLPEMQEWVAAAKAEHEEVLELDVEF